MAPLGGLSRAQVLDWLLARAGEEERLVVGLDFCFSLPAWFAVEVLGVDAVDCVWEAVAAHGERWLGESPPWPFWGRGARPRRAGLPAALAYRQTELDIERLTGARPKSIFQLVGSGQVGPGSLRGMPLLRELRAEGFAIWPFDAFSLPLVVEIYPRALTGAVVKRSLQARRTFLRRLGVLDERLLAAAAASEHAFDAACSALVMARCMRSLEALVAEGHPYDLEGRIWTAPQPARIGRGWLRHPEAAG
jgi:hypothetical protein